MGQVYKSSDTGSDEASLSKFLAKQLAFDPVFRKSFKQEARTLSSLKHPHICVLPHGGRQDAIEYLVMEHLEA